LPALTVVVLEPAWAACTRIAAPPSKPAMAAPARNNFAVFWVFILFFLFWVVVLRLASASYRPSREGQCAGKSFNRLIGFRNILRRGRAAGCEISATEKFFSPQSRKKPKMTLALRSFQPLDSRAAPLGDFE
jgi:hypothetical protein